jgi:shikimate dehydrogenase
VLGPGHWAVDLVYHPEITPFLAAADAAGARTVGGLGMLVHQAAAAFELMTGVPAPLDALRTGAALNPAG